MEEKPSVSLTPQNESSMPQSRARFLCGAFFSFLLILLVLGSFWLGYSRGKKDQPVQNESFPFLSTKVENKLPVEGQQVDFALFWRVWDLLKERYVDKESLDTQRMVYGAIKGLIKSTNDPYSSFFDPQETRDFSEDIEGSFEGIGAELGIKDDVLTVVAPLEKSPAEKAGLLPGDKILKINDESTLDMTIDEAVKRIRGKKGTEVKLVILHPEAKETKEVSITRDTIEIKSVKLELKDSIAYLKINKFSEDTNKEFSIAAQSVAAFNAKGVILDLRNNPGGLLEKSLQVANRMIPKDKVFVIEENNTGKREELRTQGGDKLSNIHTVVLINEGSASASEILASALRDNQGITLIGEKSFGKGSVQEFIPLPGNASVKITIAKWLTPKGEYIMDKGITPDIEVKMTLEDFNQKKDPQLDKAREVVGEKVK